MSTNYGAVSDKNEGNPARSAVLQSIVYDPHNCEQQQSSERAPLIDGYKNTGSSGLGVRHLIAVLGFLGFANVYTMRVNLSVAIVAMVNNTAIPHVNGSTSSACPVPDTNTTTDLSDGEFDWDEQLQGNILGSFFWGYILTQLLGGRLGEMYGGQLVMFIGVLGTALSTMLTPVVVRWNTNAFIVLRVVEGMFEGVTFPAMSSLLARWIPPLERSRTISLVYAGGTFGAVIAMPLSGVLCAGDFLGGWPAAFYVFGGLGVLWSIAWIMLTSDGPEKHRFISEQEKRFIITSLDNDGARHYKTLPIPWRHIVTSWPFLAILVAHTCQNWGFYTLLTEMPTYMKNILHYDIEQNGMVNALPYLLCWLFSLATGVAADKLRSSGTLSTTATRKLCNSIGFYIPMICLVVLGYAGCNSVLAVAMLCLSVGFNGATFAGFNTSHLDIAPNFAGTLMGITNTFATIPGFVAPIVVGYLVNGNETVGQWQIVFWMAAVAYFIGNTFYLLCYNGETQPWNEPVANTSQHHHGPQAAVTPPTFDSLGSSVTYPSADDTTQVPLVF